MSVELTIETVEEKIVLEVQDHVPAIVTIDTIPELREELDDKVDKEDIAQATGTATDKVMSQKAVTDAIASGAAPEPIVDAKVLAHNHDPAAHPTLSAFISGEADRAEAAADAAFINADVYPDVASGRAAVANGEQFQVLSADGTEYTRYRKDSASAQTEVGRFPSPKGVTAPYPFRIEASGVPYMLRGAIDDIYVGTQSRSLRLAFHTVERAGSSGWYIRVAAYTPEGVRDSSVGIDGIVATYKSATNPEPPLVNGKRRQRVSLTPQGVGARRVVDSLLIDIDWEAITVSTNLAAGAQSYAVAGFSGRVFPGTASAADLLARTSLMEALPANPKIWAKTNTFSIARLDRVFLDVTVYGADKDKRYGFGPITYHYAPDGRIILWLSELLPDGTLGDRVALFDRTGGRPSASLEGNIETVFLAPYQGSGVSAVVSVNWSALPESSPNGNATYWLYAAPTATDIELSVYGTSAEEGTVGPVGHNVIDFQVNGVSARLTTSDGYGSGGPDTLLILMHGNSGTFRYEPSASFKSWARVNKVSYACIQGQDFTSAPYASSASGWGGDVHRSRQVQLYDYLMGRYDFHRSVVLAGVSMGGLVMGQLAYYKPFPIRFCIGIGPVPNLSHIFTAGGENRKSPIRNAFGMSADGSQDALLEEFIQGADWYDMGTTGDASPRKIGYPRMYLYAGDGDATYQVDFGGATYYNSMRDSLRLAGGYCAFTVVSGVAHADESLWDKVLSDGVMSHTR